MTESKVNARVRKVLEKEFGPLDEATAEVFFQKVMVQSAAYAYVITDIEKALGLELDTLHDKDVTQMYELDNLGDLIQFPDDISPEADQAEAGEQDGGGEIAEEGEETEWEEGAEEGEGGGEAEVEEAEWEEGEQDEAQENEEEGEAEEA